jgi:hypothetical protein
MDGGELYGLEQEGLGRLAGSQGDAFSPPAPVRPSDFDTVHSSLEEERERRSDMDLPSVDKHRSVRWFTFDADDPPVPIFVGSTDFREFARIITADGSHEEDRSRRLVGLNHRSLHDRDRAMTFPAECHREGIGRQVREESRCEQIRWPPVQYNLRTGRTRDYNEDTCFTMQKCPYGVPSGADNGQGAQEHPQNRTSLLENGF